jgi:hypothetical protein
MFAVLYLPSSSANSTEDEAHRGPYGSFFFAPRVVTFENGLLAQPRLKKQLLPSIADNSAAVLETHFWILIYQSMPNPNAQLFICEKSSPNLRKAFAPEGWA